MWKGAPFSSVGRAGVHVQRLGPRSGPGVRVLAWGTLLGLTPPLSLNLFPVTSSAATNGRPKKYIYIYKNF